MFAARHPDFMERLASLRRRRDSDLAKLAALSMRDQRDRARKLLRSPNLALVYAFDAIRRTRRLNGATPDDVQSLAAQCDPFSPSRERVQQVALRVGERRVRFVQNFGPLKRMHQCLVADVLAKIHPPRQDQFLFRGGMPKALAAIEAAFRDGCTHAVEIDVIDFYGSVRPNGLAEMLRPLPASTVEHVVWDRTIRRGPDDDIAVPSVWQGDDPSLGGLVGLSLGAATSPVVGERIIALLLDAAQPGTVVTYADNILVLGRGRDDVLARAEHLREVASRLEAGPPRLRIKNAAAFRDETDHVQFASQWGQAIRHRLNWLPDQRKQDQHRIADITTALTNDQIAEAERKVVQWRRSYPMWRTGDRWMVERLAELAAARFYQDARPEHLIAAQSAVVSAWVAGRGQTSLEELLPDGSTERHRVRRQQLYLDVRDRLEGLTVSSD